MISPLDITEDAGLFPDFCGPDTSGFGMVMSRLAWDFMRGLIVEEYYKWHMYMRTWDLTWHITGRNPYA